ncbi:hypothetical protein BH10BAC4_BH10BAC4_06210 [soil metagenome]
MKLFFLITFQVLIIYSNQAQKREVIFDVALNDKYIGTLHATEEKTGNKFIRDLKSNTDAKVIILSIHVESEVTNTHEGDVLVTGVAYRHANRGVKDVKSNVKRLSSRNYQCERNGIISHLKNTEISFCTVNLYWIEPSGIKKVFSTMFVTFLPIKVLGPGKYEFVNPENRSAIYTYTNGKLSRIEMDTPVGKVISTRK